MRIIKATVEKIEDFRKDEMKDALALMGFEFVEMNFYRRIDLDGDLSIYVDLYDDGALTTVYEFNKEIDEHQFVAPIRFIDYIEDILKKHNVTTEELIDADELVLSDDGIVTAAKRVFSANKQNRHDTSRRNKTTTQDFVKKLARVKSSNVWSYAFQPKDYNKGTMLMQFKGANGGPDDIYIYYDVPNKLWQKFVAAPSKGAFFWQHIRNVFKYGKLTGDKRTHLPNGI
jgi:hypothetical protein